MFQVVCLGSVSVCKGAEVDYDRLLSKEAFQKYDLDKEEIKNIQADLATIGYNPEKIDGEIGNLTVAALKQFCEDFKIEATDNFMDDLIATLSRYAAMAREDPDWKKKIALNEEKEVKEKKVETSSEASEGATASVQPTQFEKNNEFLVSFKLTEQSLKELTDQKILPDAIMKQLEDVQDIEYANESLFKSALKAKVTGLTDQDQTLITETAKKQHPYDASKSVHWSGGSCGCVLDDLSGVVYGFYPFWMAGDKPQLVDFSVLTRIGYYALSFDDKGDIAETLQWDGEKADFIKEAHIYRTKVDLVIYKNDWKKWSQFTAEKKMDIIDKATTNIVHLVNKTLTGFFPRIKPYISWGTSSSPAMGDGVTLYFNGYPIDDDVMHFLCTFIEQLKSKLHTNGRGHFLSMMLMLPMDELSRVVQKLEDAEVIIGDTKAKAVNSYLVFLEEPTSDNKKKLRKTIEDNFKGLARRNILRKIIPVITYGGHDKQQFRDDIIYFEDNFGGVGFWPLPINTDNGADGAGKIADNAVEVVNNALTELYQKEGAKPVSSIFRFVCPNRWVFRIIWDIFTAVLLVSIVLYFTICGWRVLFMKYFLYFILGVVLPWFLLSLFLLYYDPFWKKTAEGNTPLIIVVLGIISYVLWKYFKKTRQGELP